jgi:hypothetical protein
MIKMKTTIKNILLSLPLIWVTACSDYDEKSPIPKFDEGVSLTVIPSPWTARPRLSLSDPAAGITLSMSSHNSQAIAALDIYVSYLSTANVPAAAGTGTYANFVAPVSTTGMLLPQFPDSGTSPVTISYSRYDVLINGKTTASPPVTFAPLPKTLLRTLTGSEIFSDQTFTLTELATATGITLPATVSATIANQPAFLLTFVATKTDGGVFSYLNSGPGINSNPATGEVQTRTWIDTSVTPNVPKSYTIIVSGVEGSPFIPGVSIRVAQ